MDKFKKLALDIKTLEQFFKTNNLDNLLENIQKEMFFLENTCCEQGRIISGRDKSYECNNNLINKQASTIANLKYDLYIANKKIKENQIKNNILRRNSI